MNTYRLLYLICILFCGTVEATDCSDGWVAFEGSCYLFGHDLIPFLTAEEFCNNQSSNLVHVESNAENMFLRTFLRDFKYYWIGMTDEITENVWVWHGTDSLVEYFDWAPSEPQDLNNEDCAVFGDTIGYAWADVTCSSSRKALCEMIFNAEFQKYRHGTIFDLSENFDLFKTFLRCFMDTAPGVYSDSIRLLAKRRMFLGVYSSYQAWLYRYNRMSTGNHI